MKITIRSEFDNNSYSREWLVYLKLFQDKLTGFFTSQKCKEIEEILFVFRILSNDEFFLNPVLKYSRVKKTLIFSGELRKFDLVDHTAEQIEQQLLQSFRNSLLVALEEKKIAAHSLVMELERFISDEGKGEGIGE